MKQKRKTWLVVPLCYALALVLWLGWEVFCLVYDRNQPEFSLDPASATETNELEELSGGGYAILGGDPQLVFTGLDASVRRIVLEADFAKPPGEMDLYYDAGGKGFHPRRRVWARPLDEGVYEFLLPPGRYEALRLDPGSSGSSEVNIHRIAVNTAAPVAGYLLPDGRDIAALALLPALASCGIFTIIELIRRLRKHPAGGERKPAHGE